MVSLLSPEAAHLSPNHQPLDKEGFFPESGIVEYEDILRFIAGCSIQGDSQTAEKLTNKVHQLLLAIDQKDQTSINQIKTEILNFMQNHFPVKSESSTPPPEI
ncbi:MAG: hypothetical protein COU66_02640 [Candidatus Pacebacteria bacterium CG10_big_fil_rev_8_21_14_0_10_44_11]|nr:MAG: hypothetical protein COU66_02640 [Candidatus Pacebacteria bacterium CG10_big_fil_rev_8_21_14_0_10_44_11]